MIQSRSCWSAWCNDLALNFNKIPRGSHKPLSIGSTRATRLPPAADGRCVNSITQVSTKSMCLEAELDFCRVSMFAIFYTILKTLGPVSLVKHNPPPKHATPLPVHCAHTPPQNGPKRPIPPPPVHSGPEWPKRPDHGGKLEGVSFYEGNRSQNFPRSNFP